MKNIDVEQLLHLGIEKPARYTGGEINMQSKDLNILIRFGFCFPDIYEIGMSHLGMTLLYEFINERVDSYCERIFMPWSDMEKVMRDTETPLFSLETKTPIKNFDILGFTLQYEMCYTTVLSMLDLGGISLYAKDRGDDEPIVCAGGPCTYNPEPIADFFDFFYIGEGEASLPEILDTFAKNKECGGTKKQFLTDISHIKGVYVPSIVNNETKVEKAVVYDLDKSFFPKKQIVPFIETVHDRVALEIFRGCIRGCRFCQAGFISRPVREKSVETLINQAKNLISATGHEEISLVSLSTCDYTQLTKLAEALLKEYEGKGVNLSLPSVRIDSFTLELLKKTQGFRKSGLTFAPEAGSQRLRNIINKNLSEEEILNGCRLAFSCGWDKVKLYFMIGLPHETDDDILQISVLCDNIIREYYKQPKEKRRRPISITVSVSCFVPKPFTPFQWVEQNTEEEFFRKQKLLKKALTQKQVKYNYHHSGISVIEGVLARGDRRLCRVIENAFRLGAGLEGWSERFDYSIWGQAIKQEGLSVSDFTKERKLDEKLPWDFISAGVDKAFLISENQRASNEQVTPDCRSQCSACGVGNNVIERRFRGEISCITTD